MLQGTLGRAVPVNLRRMEAKGQKGFESEGSEGRGCGRHSLRVNEKVKNEHDHLERAQKTGVK